MHLEFHRHAEKGIQSDFQKKVVATSMLYASLLKPNIRQHFRAHKESLKAQLTDKGLSEKLLGNA